jgi:hypothetical protein
VGRQGHHLHLLRQDLTEGVCENFHRCIRRYCHGDWVNSGSVAYHQYRYLGEKAEGPKLGRCSRVTPLSALPTPRLTGNIEPVVKVLSADVAQDSYSCSSSRNRSTLLDKDQVLNTPLRSTKMYRGHTTLSSSAAMLISQLAFSIVASLQPESLTYRNLQYLPRAYAGTSRAHERSCFCCGGLAVETVLHC